MLYSSFVIAKYNEKEERIELEQCNKKAQAEFEVSDNEKLKNFLMSISVQQVYQEEKTKDEIFKMSNFNNLNTNNIVNTNNNVNTIHNNNNINNDNFKGNNNNLAKNIIKKKNSNLKFGENKNNL